MLAVTGDGAQLALAGDRLLGLRTRDIPALGHHSHVNTGDAAGERGRVEEKSNEACLGFKMLFGE